MRSGIRNILGVLRDSIALTLLLTVVVQLTDNRLAFADLRKVFVETLLYTGIMMMMADGIFRNLWHLIERRESEVQWTAFIAVLVVISGVGSILGSLALAGLRSDGASFQSLLQTSFKICLFVSLVIGVNEASYERLQGQLKDTKLKLRTEELEREHALKLAAEARLGALEARVHPHFLFNSLNSIASLIATDPGRAERLVRRMASLLRFSLESHEGGLVAWEREMRTVQDYLEIEQARLGPRLRYKLETSSELDGFLLPPLSVQTLVENSIKYAVAPEREGGQVRVHAERQGDTLRIQVSDTGPGFSLESASPGHGLDNLRGRLSEVFGDSAKLDVDRRDGWTTVTLQVPS